MIHARFDRLWLLAWLFVTCSAGNAAAAADANAGAKGDQWETTSQMTMPGMPMGMPASKHTQCSPKDWHEPPGASGEHGCTNTDMQSTGNKITWKVQCPDMTGVGEITRDTPDA